MMPTPNKPISTNGKYPSLNGLRAISILMVIFSHLTIQGYIPYWKSLYIHHHWMIPTMVFVSNGQLGVNIFFVISGFLITSLLLNEEKRTSTISLKGFYMRRILRIFPAYYFLLLVYFILQLLHVIYLSKLSWLTSLTYTKYFNWQADWFTAHAWSLSIEEQFYLFWPFIFLLGNKTRKFIAWLLFFIPVVVRLYTSSHIYILSHPHTWINALTLPVRIDAIATGCLLALYLEKMIRPLTSSVIRQRYFRRIFYMVAIGLYLLEWLPPANNKIQSHLLGYIITAVAGSYGTIANICIGIILLYAVFGPKGRWFKFLNSRPLNYIGLLSYSLYLWQQIFVSGFGDKYWIGAFPQNLVFIFAAALFSHYVIERPFLKLKERFKK